MKLLLIEDSKRLRESLTLGLRRAGYVIDATGDGKEGFWMAKTGDYDTIILDIMLPGMDGLTILERLREEDNPTHILMLTAKDKIGDKVAGLKTGADDYLVKPFSMDELEARVEALCRRSYGIKKTTIEVEGLSIDLATKRVVLNQDLVELKPREYRILEYLSMRRGEVVTQSEIESHIYDDLAEVRSNVVESAISSIRRKLSTEERPAPIKTRRGLGYIFDEGFES